MYFSCMLPSLLYTNTSSGRGRTSNSFSMKQYLETWQITQLLYKYVQTNIKLVFHG